MKTTEHNNTASGTPAQLRIDHAGVTAGWSGASATGRYVVTASSVDMTVNPLYSVHFTALGQLANYEGEAGVAPLSTNSAAGDDHEIKLKNTTYSIANYSICTRAKNHFHSKNTDEKAFDVPSCRERTCRQPSRSRRQKKLYTKPRRGGIVASVDQLIGTLSKDRGHA